MQLILAMADALARVVRGEPIGPEDIKRLEAFRAAAGNFVGAPPRRRRSTRLGGGCRHPCIAAPRRS